MAQLLPKKATKIKKKMKRKMGKLKTKPYKEDEEPLVPPNNPKGQTPRLETILEELASLEELVYMYKSA